MAANVSFFIVDSDMKVDVGGSSRLGFVARKTDCSAVLTFRMEVRSGGFRVRRVRCGFRVEPRGRLMRAES